MGSFFGAGVGQMRWAREGLVSLRPAVVVCSSGNGTAFENSPENRHSVIGRKSIAGDQDHLLDPRLGYEQPVKRIPVVEG